MAQTINTNVASLNAQRNLNRSQGLLNTVAGATVPRVCELTAQRMTRQVSRFPNASTTQIRGSEPGGS